MCCLFFAVYMTVFFFMMDISDRFLWNLAGFFGDINAWAFLEYLILLHPRYDALAEIIMHLFAFWWSQATFLELDMRAVWPLSIWYWMDMDLNFSSLDGLELANLLAADYLISFWFIIHLWDFISMLVLLWFFCFWSPDSVDLTWYNQEWWNKSAKIKLNCCMVFDFFSAEKFLVNIMIFMRIFCM